MSKIRIEYDEHYPNLCYGNLIVFVDDEKFLFPNCLMSGGGLTEDYENTYKGEWTITDWPKNFPEELKNDVLKIVNEQIPFGCCGGCI